MRGAIRGFLAIAVLALLPAAVFAQEGEIAGTVRDTSGAVMPGVTVEVTSPALIEKVRTAITDSNGQYQLTNLPVGTYTVTFTLQGFSKQQRDNVVLQTGFTAPVNAIMTVGQLTETVVVTGASPVVDVQNARQAITFEGDRAQGTADRAQHQQPARADPRHQQQLPRRSGRSARRASASAASASSATPASAASTSATPARASLSAQGPGTRGQHQPAPGPRDGGRPGGQRWPRAASAGMTGGYTADIANAQEVNIQVSGALGESETGGASINIVPRTGGNRFAGDFNTTYTTAGVVRPQHQRLSVGAGDSSRRSSSTTTCRRPSAARSSATGCGSIARPRRRGSRSCRSACDFWPNLNEGKYGLQLPARSRRRSRRVQEHVEERQRPHHLAGDAEEQVQLLLGRAGLLPGSRATASCRSSRRPSRGGRCDASRTGCSRCRGRIRWNNKILLEAGLSVTPQYNDTTRHREYDNPRSIPRVHEIGDTAGADTGQAASPRSTRSPGNSVRRSRFRVGALRPDVRLVQHGARRLRPDAARPRPATARARRSPTSPAAHHAKIGYDGGYFTQARPTRSTTRR